MTFEEINDIYDIKIKEYQIEEVIYNEYLERIASAENIWRDNKELFLKLEPNIKKQFFDEDLKESLKPRTVQEKARKLYRTYLNAYKNACIEVRNSMFATKDWQLYFPYIFLLLHTVEMTLKFLKIYNVDGFSSINANHKILKAIKDNKISFINLGIDNDVYEEFVALLTKLDGYTTKDDLAVSFKYPLDLDFSTPIVTKLLVDITEKDIRRNIEDEKKILLICQLIYVVAVTKNIHHLNSIVFPKDVNGIEDATKNSLMHIFCYLLKR